MSRYIRYKYQKQQINYLNCNDLDKWIDTCQTRLTGFDSICSGSCNCTTYGNDESEVIYSYKKLNPNYSYDCLDGNRYYKLQKQVSYDGGLTYVDMDEYKTGDLYESNSPFCSAETVLMDWFESDNYCVGTDLYKREVKRVSFDGGNTWSDMGYTDENGVTTYEYRSSKIESNSCNCGYRKYKYIETDERITYYDLFSGDVVDMEIVPSSYCSINKIDNFNSEIKIFPGTYHNLKELVKIKIKTNGGCHIGLTYDDEFNNRISGYTYNDYGDTIYNSFTIYESGEHIYYMSFPFYTQTSFNDVRSISVNVSLIENGTGVQSMYAKHKEVAYCPIDNTIYDETGNYKYDTTYGYCDEVGELDGTFIVKYNSETDPDFKFNYISDGYQLSPYFTIKMTEDCGDIVDNGDGTKTFTTNIYNLYVDENNIGVKYGDGLIRTGCLRELEDFTTKTFKLGINYEIIKMPTTRKVGNMKRFMSCWHNGEYMIIFDPTQIDTRFLSSARRMFYGSNFNNGYLDLSTWDVSHLIYDDINYGGSISYSWEGLFSYCYADKINISGWNLLSSESMRYMFGGFMGKELILDNVNTSNIENMYGTFYQCENLISLDLSSWSTNKVTTMDRLFFKCNSLETLNVTGWKVQQVETYTNMFTNCSSLNRLILGEVTQLTYNWWCDRLSEAELSCNIIECTITSNPGGGIDSAE